MLRINRFILFAIAAVGFYCVHQALVWGGSPLAIRPSQNAPVVSPSNEKSPPDSPPPISNTDNLGTSKEDVSKPSDSSDEGVTWGADFITTFLQDVEFALPKIDLNSYAKYSPHHYNGEAGVNTFATFLCTRNNSIHDPYFIATQQLVYRNLWSPSTSSTKHPFTVFVAPFISSEQRSLLAGAGAIVREIPLIDWKPKHDTTSKRFRDVFSKLHFWNQTEFRLIAYMDSDAFPIANIDGIFDVAKQSTCKVELLDEDDSKVAGEICSYTMSAYEDPGIPGNINAGVIVLSPNTAMHARLLRNIKNTDNYLETYPEQSYLTYQFGVDSPFPATFFGREWNGVASQEEDEGKLRIVHEKLWNDAFGPKWVKGMFRRNWEEMCEFYESEAFDMARRADGLAVN